VEKNQPQSPNNNQTNNTENNKTENNNATASNANNNSNSTNNPSCAAASSPSDLAKPAHPGHNKSPSIVNPKKQSTEDKYSVLKVLGEGASCKVVSVQNKSSGQRLAMKILDKAESYNKILFENETFILKTLKHENVLEFVESYEDKKTYHLLTVLCQGGELFDRVKNGSFSEKVASRLAREMLQALEYCHRHSIVHRDLKPENFVFETSREDSNMKLIDFGCAKLALDDEVVSDVAGSPYYCAPEVLSDNTVRTGAVWKAADMWSVGVIIFLLVCGYPPFNGESQERIFKKIKKGKYRFPQASELGGVDLSPSVKLLITGLLQMKPSDRLTAAQALNDPWVRGETASDTPLPSVVVEALGAFRSKCRLKKAVGRVLGHKMTEDDKLSLQEVFKQFDTNGDGQLGPEEIARLMKHIGKNESDAASMLANLDDDGDGGVSLNEFASAAALAKLKSENEIKASFDLFDLDRDGFVTHKEIEKICEFLTPEAADLLIKEVDRNSDGKINFSEWLAAMTDIDAKIARANTAKRLSVDNTTNINNITPNQAANNNSHTTASTEAAASVAAVTIEAAAIAAAANTHNETNIADNINNSAQITTKSSSKPSSPKSSTGKS
jgi:calcium-dependent protein kinase